MKISSVYIVKNEEKNIEKSISTIKNICDEIIVVDTGSTDDTVEICEHLGCKIYNYKWDNDFSKARNYAISLCSNEIVIFLDADEYFTKVLDEQDRAIIENYFSNKVDVVGCFEIDMDKTTNTENHTSYVYKIMKNNMRYTGSIHEHLVYHNPDLKVQFTQELQLIHTGYSSEVSKSKLERNLAILNLIEDKSTMDYYYLGRENLALGNYKEAETNLNLFFASKDVEEHIKNNNIGYLAYIYKLNVMEHLKDKYTSKDILEYLLYAKTRIPHIPEIYFCLGVYYMDIDLKKSMAYFDECIKKNEIFNEKYFQLNNFLGYQDKIYYYRAKLLAYMGKKNEAIQKAIVACMLNKKDRDNLGLLLHLLNRQKYKENIELLNRIYRPNSKVEYEFLVQGLENTNLYTEFLTYSLAYNQEYKGGVDSLYYAMMLNGDYKSALDSLVNFDNDKKNFIMTVILLFANDGELLEQYFEYLPEKYLDILRVLIQQDFTQAVDFDLLINIVCKLVNYGVLNIPAPIWQYILTNATTDQIMKLMLIYSNNQQYKEVVALLSFCIYDLHNYNDKIIYQYLFAIYNFKGYQDFEMTNYEYFISEYFNLLEFLEIKHKYKYLVKAIRNKIIKKSYVKLKKKLMKEMEHYAEG